jgi:hypothetical protein
MQAPRNKRPITNACAPQKRACAPRKRACAPRKRACHCEPPSSRSGIGAIAMVRRRVFRPPFCTAFKIGGRLGVDCQVGVLLFVSVLQKARTSPPLPRFARRCPPGLVGFLARIWTSRFASGALMKLIADLEAPRRKTQTSKKPRDRPTPGGSAAGAGGVSSHSARPATRSPPPGGSAAGAGARPNAQREEDVPCITHCTSRSALAKPPT